jgi:hypothetical protein
MERRVLVFVALVKHLFPGTTVRFCLDSERAFVEG